MTMPNNHTQYAPMSARQIGARHLTKSWQAWRGLSFCLLFCLSLGLLALLAWPVPAVAGEPVLHIGSKRFAESYILGEILRQSAAAHGKAEHRQGLGNTAIVLAALQTGSIDIYPDYTGTINFEVLQHKTPSSLAQMRLELAKLGLGMAVPLGFNNTYAFAMRADDSRQRGITRISDLARATDVRFGLSPEFLGRNDGWPSLAKRYGLPQQPRLLDNGVAYQALAGKQIDLIDAYSTSSQIGKFDLTVLKDDLNFFPRYDAVLLYRLDIEQRFPKAWAAFQALEGQISDADMLAMNARAELHGESFAAIARNFLSARAAPMAAKQPTADPAASGASTAPPPQAGRSAHTGLMAKLFDGGFLHRTGQHVTLVLVSVLLACLFALPLGVLAAYQPGVRQVVMALVGVLQTVPSLALLAMLIPLLGQIGLLPAIIALFLYALLPIVRNTCIGLLQVPPGLRLAALALGMTRGQRLRYVDLPLALPTILAGIKTAAVVSVGGATIAAFIGAGGYGETIVIGLSLNDNTLLLAGAIPAAVLALLTQMLFEAIEWYINRRPH
jgi:osmoprotectant transport system permease protein